MMGWYGGGVGWAGWITMTLIMVAFWAVVAFAVLAMFRGSGGGGQSTRPVGPRTPMDVLEERFARGEIDAEELRSRAEILRESHH